jgi:DNA repair photolyase
MDTLNNVVSIRPTPATSFLKSSPPTREVVEQIEKSKTPVSDAILAEGKELDLLSKYPCNFDYSAYKGIELRYSDKPIRGGITLGTVFRLVNSHSTCQQCLYAFEIDTYGRGCIHECGYCYAKAELTVHGYWNNPVPVPVDINEIRKTFYTVFETEKKNKWRELLEKRIPIRIGSMSDSFMWMDTKFKVTQELLKILSYYNYPYVIFTRSDLVAHDDYLKLLDPKLAAIQFSMSSTNETLIRKIEPGAPSVKRRLKALEKLADAGHWTTVRINPLFPIRPDGFYTDPNFKWNGEVPKFDFSSFEMVDELAAHKVPAILAGFVRLSAFAVNNLERASGVNLREFYRKDLVNKSVRDFHFSDKEIRFYYEKIRERCLANGIQFTTCYIGNGDGHFWKDQDLWSNKKDCCNIKQRVPGFKTDAREISFEQRLKFTNHKKSVATDPDRLHEELGKGRAKLVVEKDSGELNKPPFLDA